MHDSDSPGARDGVDDKGGRHLIVAYRSVGSTSLVKVESEVSTFSVTVVNVTVT